MLTKRINGKFWLLISLAVTLAFTSNSSVVEAKAKPAKKSTSSYSSSSSSDSTNAEYRSPSSSSYGFARQGVKIELGLVLISNYGTPFLIGGEYTFPVSGGKLLGAAGFHMFSASKNVTGGSYKLNVNTIEGGVDYSFAPSWYFGGRAGMVMLSGSGTSTNKIAITPIIGFIHSLSRSGSVGGEFRLPIVFDADGYDGKYLMGYYRFEF